MSLNYKFVIHGFPQLQFLWNNIVHNPTCKGASKILISVTEEIALHLVHCLNPFKSSPSS